MFVMADTNSKDVWFEVHKLPRELWIKELETIETAMQKQKEQEQKEAVY